MSIRILSKELQEIAENELNEDSNRIQSDLYHIRDWVARQSYLNIRNDDQWLLSFLRNAKFSLERAKRKIDQYYTMRSISPELYERDPFSPELQEILRRGVVSVIVDEMKPSLPAVMVLRWAKTDPETVPLLNIIRIILMFLDVILNENDNVTISGMHFLGNMKEMPIGYVAQFTPSMCKKIAMALEDATPLRFKGIFCINAPFYAEPVINLGKPFLNEKMKQRLHVYGENFKDLFNKMPASVIPKEFGGEARSLDETKDEWKVKLESYRDWFLDDAKYGTDENKRPGKPKLASDIFGAHGSFRKLNID